MPHCCLHVLAAYPGVTTEWFRAAVFDIVTLRVGDSPATALSSFWLTHCIRHLKHKNKVCSWPGVLCLYLASRRAGKGTKARKSKLSERILSQVGKHLFFQGKLKWSCELQAELTVLDLFSKLQLTLIKLLLSTLFVKKTPKAQTNPQYSQDCSSAVAGDKKYKSPDPPKVPCSQRFHYPWCFPVACLHIDLPLPKATFGVWMLHLWHS